ncbi:MAG TPA: hypothetical protein VH025_01545 [Solirubrobacteraceae bacterium]|nr:hypothetical protein [Solirubrobacteraceae bacterium]
MATVMEPPPKAPEPAGGPDGGVVRDARALRRRRRRRLAGAVLAGALLVGLLAWITGAGDGSRSGPHARAGASLARRERQRLLAIVPHISPSLEGGSYGWCITDRGSGSCASLPTQSAVGEGHYRAIGTLAGASSSRTEEALTVLIARSVRSVRDAGFPTRLETVAPLPFGMVLAHVVIKRHTGGAEPPRGVESAKLLAYGVHGRLLGPVGPESLAAPTPRRRWWKAPTPVPSGPCSIAAQGMPALRPQWGHVAARIEPYPVPLIGRAFFSCIDTEYYLHRWPLVVATLLDARHPGRTPAAIPGMKPIPRTRGVFSAPASWNGAIAAVRHGDAWLVVAGGSGLAQRLRVLSHVHIHVSLPSGTD